MTKNSAKKGMEALRSDCVTELITLAASSHFCSTDLLAIVLKSSIGVASVERETAVELPGASCNSLFKGRKDEAASTASSAKGGDVVEVFTLTIESIRRSGKEVGDLIPFHSTWLDASRIPAWEVWDN